MIKGDLSAAVDALQTAEALLITAGAGLGVDSGFPDFRGSSGFWKAYPPYARLGIEFVELACPETLIADPALFWGFYEHRRVLYRHTKPHAGYEILKKLADTHSSFVFTSNVDGHFLRGGFEETQLVECHGNIHHLQCATPCSDRLWEVVESHLVVDPTTMRTVGTIPQCSQCGEYARPNVLLFGDDSWVDTRTATQLDRYENWLKQIRGARLVVVELGAGTAIPTVRLESQNVAARHKGMLIRINPREFALDARKTIHLQGTALATLTAIAAMM
jgi:NAD-dependent SIR2 family protein deacetylase